MCMFKCLSEDSRYMDPDVDVHLLLCSPCLTTQQKKGLCMNGVNLMAARTLIACASHQAYMYCTSLNDFVLQIIKVKVLDMLDFYKC